MPTTLSVYDAKAKFSSVLANVEEKCVTADRRFAQYGVETLR